jgi:hypothetical protein
MTKTGALSLILLAWAPTASSAQAQKKYYLEPNWSVSRCMTNQMRNGKLTQVQAMWYCNDFNVRRMREGMPSGAN